MLLREQDTGAAETRPFCSAGHAAANSGLLLLLASNAGAVSTIGELPPRLFLCGLCFRRHGDFTAQPGMIGVAMATLVPNQRDLVGLQLHGRINNRER